MPNINEFQLTAAEKAALENVRAETLAPHSYSSSPYYNEVNGRAFERALRNHLANGRKGGIWRAHSGGDTFTTLRSKIYCGKAWCADHVKDPVIQELLPLIRIRGDKGAGTLKMTELAQSGGIYQSVDSFTAYKSDAEHNAGELKETFIAWAQSAQDGELFDVSNLDLSIDDVKWFCDRRDELQLMGRIERTRIMVAMVKGAVNEVLPAEEVKSGETNFESI